MKRASSLLLVSALLGLIAPAAHVRAEGTGLDNLPSLEEGAAATAAETPVAGAAQVSPSESAAQNEMDGLKNDVGALKDKSQGLDEAQQKMRKKLNGILNQTAVRVNGLGLGLASNQRQFGPMGAAVVSTTNAVGLLDLRTSGVIGREVQWGFLTRVSSGQVPSGIGPANPGDLSGLFPSEIDPGNVLSVLRVTGTWSPSFLSLTLGDFDESYTPLTLWNRDAQDLKAAPEFIDRVEKFSLYSNGFLDAAPLVPLRGARLSVKFDRPKGRILQGLEASTFVHMVKNGFNNSSYGSGFTTWCVGGKGHFTFRPGAELDAYGMLYDDQPGTSGPSYVYDDFVPSTWPHRYWVGSVRPKLERGFSGVTLGAQMEIAGNKYEADLQRPERTLHDFAYYGGPYVKKGESVLKFQYLEVGPSFYSPFAQVRQRSVTAYTSVPSLETLGDPSNYFLTYNRGEDNTFPYGLATPNRKGFGLDLDLKALQDDAFTLSASFYKVEEIMGNLVVDDSYTYLVPVENPALSVPPMRKFTYANVGPRLDAAKLLKRKLPLEISLNVRSEKTVSSLGTLKSTGVVPGLRAGVAKGWEWNLAYAHYRYQGVEAGLNGTLTARYSYWYDPTDRTHYSQVPVDSTGGTIFVSTKIAMGKSSDLSLDGWTSSGKSLDVANSRMRSQYLGFMHETRF